jgi:inorganic pyrophosphatase
VKVFIECERGSRIKRNYGIDLKLKRRSETLLPYPYPYGFIPGTRADDGDGVDCYVLTEEPLEHGRIVEAEPAALLPMTEDGEEDGKILAVPPGRSLDEFPEAGRILRDFILGIFRKFPEVRVTVGDLRSRDSALEFLAARTLPEQRRSS